MEAVYPAAASALCRGRRQRRPAPRLRHRTTPVTFAEIKEVDEENSEVEVCEERKRRPDVLEESLGRQFAEFRRRRARRDLLPEREHESPPPAATAAPPAVPPAAATAGPPAVLPATAAPGASSAQLARAGSEPAALHRSP